eukprot:TRINITY_DN888_c0_g1_i5.p1 TRINITY_DN888_c0_g1~~TRINITY_DN888_c0_g1_i5.p1  ORF type:complete len:392 (-),score=-13.33 TRINITY_DN888_c0_g1_i5:49-1224(-)
MEMVQFEDILEGLSEFVRIIKASRILSGVLVRYQKKGVVLIFVDWKFFLSASRLIQQSSIILIFHTSHRIQKRNALFLQMLLKLLLYVFLLLLLQKDQKYFVFQVSKYFDLCLFLLFLGKINKREIWTIFLNFKDLLFLGKINKREIWTIFLNFKDFIFVDQIIYKRFSIIAFKKRIEYTCLFLLFLGKINKRNIWTIFLNFKDFIFVDCLNYTQKIFYVKAFKKRISFQNVLVYKISKNFYICIISRKDNQKDVLVLVIFRIQDLNQDTAQIIRKKFSVQNIEIFLLMYCFEEKQIKGRFVAGYILHKYKNQKFRNKSIIIVVLKALSISFDFQQQVCVYIVGIFQEIFQFVVISSKCKQILKLQIVQFSLRVFDFHLQSISCCSERMLR